jgi:hypothetical protein
MQMTVAQRGLYLTAVANTAKGMHAHTPAAVIRVGAAGDVGSEEVN